MIVEAGLEEICTVRQDLEQKIEVLERRISDQQAAIEDLQRLEDPASWSVS